jgi:MoaF N-terminal domain
MMAWRPRLAAAAAVLAAQSLAESADLAGRAFRFDYGDSAYRVRYLSDSKLEWEQLKGPAVGLKGTETYGSSVVRPGVTFVWWQEADTSIVTQVVDLEQRRVHTTWTSADKKLAAFQGTIVADGDKASPATGAAPEATPPASNAELAQIVEDDQTDRQAKSFEDIDWAVVSKRDLARLSRTKELYAQGRLRTGEDWQRAALVLQHSNEADDYLLAHDMTLAALRLGEKSAGWLAAATEDRFLHQIGRKQRFATQYAPAGPGKFRLAETDPAVSDELRDAVGVPSLAEAKATEKRFDKQ